MDCLIWGSDSSSVGLKQFIWPILFTFVYHFLEDVMKASTNLAMYGIGDNDIPLYDAFE